MPKLISVPPALAALIVSALLGIPNTHSAPPDASAKPDADSTASAVAPEPEDPSAALRKTIRAKLIALVAESALEIPPANIPEDLSDRVKARADDRRRFLEIERHPGGHPRLAGIADPL